MITIDGNERPLDLAKYNNLEEILILITKPEDLGDRIVTDVFLNGEPFSELYPHQAEDISTSEISSLELKTAGFVQMSQDVICELPKVVKLIGNSTKSVAELFREGDLAEALEFLQDLVDVSRNLLNTIEPLLLSKYAEGVKEDLKDFTNNFSSILSEINEAMSYEDWVLVADLLEFEYGPQSKKLSKVIERFAKNAKEDIKVN